MSPQVPRDFQLGVATSSWQIEGDVTGRGLSTWDEFAQRPGAILDGATGEPACDHVRRLDEDLDRLAWLGVDAYRFSISWPRVVPGGAGQPSSAGLGFYDRLVDGLLARGIEPVATMYHWDLPLELEQAGGWPKRETALRFADYASVTAERLGDRVVRWATLNEPWCTAFPGYASGYFAPGRREPGAALAAAYHLMLGHGLAVDAMRQAGARNIGIVLNCFPVLADTPEMAEAAAHVDGLQNQLFLDLLTGKGVPAQLLARCAASTDWSFVNEADRAIMGVPIDWIGENYYTVTRVGPPAPGDWTSIAKDGDAYPDAPPLSFAPRAPLTDMEWEVIPQGLVDALHRISQAVPDVPIWVTENGAAVPESRGANGLVHDPLRVDYLSSHIAAALQARDEGVDVRGYFAWSLMDNVEWASGWTIKFGLFAVDPTSGTRAPKASAHWYRRLIESRGSFLEAGG
ncbi:MAG: family 1 glycosylhydrolase [Actinomycetales bacterium]|nr:family 1 glycosylhydrolase [Actinomycetales bacterium]